MQHDFKLDQIVKSSHTIMYEGEMTIPGNARGQIVHPPSGSNMRKGYVWVMWDSKTKPYHTSCACLEHA